MTIDQVQKMANDIHDQSNLIGYAAYAAIAELLQNWRAAVTTGAVIEELAGDLDHVILELQNFREELRPDEQVQS